MAKTKIICKNAYIRFLEAQSVKKQIKSLRGAPKEDFFVIF